VILSLKVSIQNLSLRWHTVILSLEKQRFEMYDTMYMTMYELASREEMLMTNMLMHDVQHLTSLH
jgi:hypothetical protein